ncbi:hypothetical protein GUITHDRAFT_159902 [Guillardia theta CCMP2712]|uniref:Dynein regulatory complex protein 1 n=1 Tax=Guillardia theta (strain CCMP2712) TaxID=905079 RepID=L1IZ95_GUITC|nr:hypothetical protein GUITHDRAFT_159902 [Guillardia theta CCMP2712]EKX41219.1 hypothetical protein GUITHDRAFT_159902 [Guillardia theta CCMP2712]|eukprot:XP_005828199.1 hypothetical protein GUITHDRAFT_159902 [Guillardia theta CCMP2712]
MAESKRRLQSLLEQGDEAVTKVRVEGDDSENNRRTNEEARRLDRRQKLLFEAESSARRNAAIAMKWAALFEKEVPLELLHEMEAQREACMKVISQKDELIKEFQGILKSKDEEYVKSLKRWSEDIDLLLASMTEQFQQQQQQYEQETEEIEAVFRQERKELIESNKKEMEALMEKRRNMEQAHMEERQRRIEANQEQLQRNRLKDNEAYTEKKITLESEIQKLEQQLEVMRATYQLNTEKLEYNFRVLSERDVENTNTINQQKRKLARLQDNLSSLMSKYNKTDKQYNQENINLTEEYRRITEQFQDLQMKYQHFQLADAKKFDEIWGMKEGEVKELLGQVLQADKIIHEQQLGLYWYPPDEDARRGGFLVEAKIKGVVEEIARGEGERLKIESILKALGISSQQDVERLQRFFYSEDEQGESELISQDQACLAIKQFLKEQMAQSTVLTTTFHSTHDEGEERKSTSRNIWELCTSILSPKTFRVWTALEKFMIKYNDILTERSTLLDETRSLQTQNEELKLLLNQYLGSKINQELYVPPTATISRIGETA